MIFCLNGCIHGNKLRNPMKKFNFKKINAFATQSSEGNPAGMVYLDESENISTDEMLTIASELKGYVSEVGYVRKIGDNYFDLKYYSSEREVDFCGHATIAIMYDLIKNSEELTNIADIKIQTNKGLLFVENRLVQQDAVFISAPLPFYTQTKLTIANIADALSTSIEDIAQDQQISIINAGLETLVVPVNRLHSLLSISPNLDQLNTFCSENKIDIIILFSHEVANSENKFRTRVFAPTFGYLEDPATGSGNSALGYYLIKNKKWDGHLISIEQNNNEDAPNIIKLKTKTIVDNQIQVLFGGGAVVKIEGEYWL